MIKLQKVLIILVVILIFHNTLDGDFLSYDDNREISQKVIQIPDSNG